MDLARHGAVRAVEHEGSQSVALQSDSRVVHFDADKRAEYTTETPPPPAFTLLLSPLPEPVSEERPAPLSPAPHVEQTASPALSVAPGELITSSAAPDAVQDDGEQLDLADAVLGSFSADSAPPPEVSVKTRPEPAPSPPARPLAEPEPEPEEQHAAAGPSTPRSARLEVAAPLASPLPESADSQSSGTTTRSTPPRSEAPASAPSSPLRVALITLAAAAVSYGVVRYAVAPDSAGPAESASSSAAPSVAAAGAVAAPEAAQPGKGLDNSQPKGSPLTASTKSAGGARTVDLPLPPGVVITKSKGLLEVETGGKQAIYVDDVFVGRGPMRRVPLEPGSHNVELRDGVKIQRHSVNIVQGRRARMTLAGDENQGQTR
jgi:hypothetical protein